MCQYSFRAECLHDVLSFLAKVGEEVRIVKCDIRQDIVFPDCDVELDVAHSLSRLKKIADEILDLHVISESLELRQML